MIELYKTFVAVVESGTLLEAAKLLHANQPNLTVRIKKLEEQLEVKLFEREGKKLILTPIGKEMYGYAKTLLNLQHTITSEIRLHRDSSYGSIRIGGVVPFLHYLLPDFLQEFNKKFQEITYQIKSGTSDEIYKLIEQYEIDFGFVTTSYPNKDIIQHELNIHSQIYLVVSADSELAKKEQIFINDVSQLPLIMFNEETIFSNSIKQYLLDQGVNINIKMEVDHIELMLQMVEGGLGVAFIPLPEVSKFPPRKEIKVIGMEDLSFPNKTFKLIYRKNRFLPPSHHEFINAWKRG